jgi:hypothetical protein
MQRFIGLLMALAGGLATLWGGYHSLNGEAGMRLTITPDISFSARAVGLTGLLVFTIGLVWTRD